MTLTRTERILAILNFYLPHKDLYQYNYEADTIAQSVRKNSNAASISRLVREQFPDMDDDLIAAITMAKRGWKETQHDRSS